MTIANESVGKSHMSCSTCNRPLPGVYDGKPPRADANGVMHAWCCPSLPPATGIPQEDGAREGVARYFATFDGTMEAHREGEWIKWEDALRHQFGDALADCHLALLAKVTAERDAALGRYADAVLEADRARAELATVRTLMREGARHIGPMIYFSEPDLAKRIDALLVDQITPTPAAERGGSP